MAIAGRILVEIILVVFLSRVEILQGQVLNGKLAMNLLLLLLEGFSDNGLVLFVHIIDAGAILCATVVALPVDAGRVDRLEIHFQKES